MSDNYQELPNERGRAYTLQELRRLEADGIYLVAYDGVVYDVSDCPKWRSGIHEWLHFPAQDLSGELTEAPHDREVFQRPCVKRVGVLTP